MGNLVPSNVKVPAHLADKINAQIGSSRPVVDAGWLDHSRQIGSSGQTVSPKLYFAIGISGAIQHLVGMKGAKNIIAINKDVNAPIFEIAEKVKFTIPVTSANCASKSTPFIEIAT